MHAVSLLYNLPIIQVKGERGEEGREGKERPLEDDY